MRFVLATARKDWHRYRRNLPELLLYIGIPLIIGGVIVLSFGGAGGGPTPQAHVLIVDDDDSLASHLLVGALSQEDTGAPVRAEKVTQAEGRRRIDDGDASALLVIPAGFGKAVLEETTTTLQLWVNPSQTILPRLVEEMLSILSDGFFYMHRLFGNELQLIANGPPPGQNTLDDLIVGGMAVAINQRMERLVDNFDPLRLKLEIKDLHPDEEAAIAAGEEQAAEEIPGGFGALFLPGIIMMSMLFMSMGSAGDIWVEREQRTLRRVVTAPRSVFAFMAGKSLASAGLMLVVCLVGLGIGYLYLGLSIRTLPISALWAAAGGVMLFTLMTAVQVSASSQRAGQILGLVLVFPLMMMGGSFFPFEAMPTWMQTVGRFTPNGYVLIVLKDLVRGLRGAVDLLVPALVLIAVATAFSVYCALRMRAFARR